MQTLHPHIDLVVSSLCQRKLGASIVALENYLLTSSNQSSMEELSAIKYDYQLMSDYWQRGVDDTHRTEVYGQLLHRLYALTTDIKTSQLYRENSYWQLLYLRPRKHSTDWALTSVKSQLENYVAEVAMLEFEPDHIRNAKRKELDTVHQQFLCNLFDYVQTSFSWTDTIARSFDELLLSPTIDSHDQQLIVSAITMALFRMFDVHKLLTLIRVYRQTTDIRLRQRALVGWSLTIDSTMDGIYPEIRRQIAEICEDEQCVQELTELQMQLFYCKDAESDEQKIRDEIMPDLMNGSRMKFSNRGLEEIEEDTLEDILHPEAAERNMEKMEQSMKRMADMQRQGSDIYFAGFSQMKRFPFFDIAANWFAPFSPYHPAICDIWNHAKGKKFLHTITEMAAFCDSDRYSFVLAFEQVLSHLPASMLKMVDEGEAMPMPIGGEVADEERQSPAFIRRIYLQNLYRFFRLFAMRSQFHNPFSDEADYLFFANELFAGSQLEKRMSEMGAFLLKRGKKSEAKSVLDNCKSIGQDYQYYMLMGTMLFDGGLKSAEVPFFEKAVSLKPDSRKALVGLARAYFHHGDYNKALEIYERLLELSPESKSYQLNAAICLSNLHQEEQALKYLYKLNYLYPDDATVTRVLAWVLLTCGRTEESQKHYENLLQQESVSSQDVLYAGYCHWFLGHISSAISSFRRYLSFDDADIDKFEEALFISDKELLMQHQITDTDIRMMLDALVAL